MDPLAGERQDRAAAAGGRAVRPAAAYGVTVVAVLAAFGVRLALAPWIEHVFLFFYPVVALAALRGGRGPALLATGLSTALAGGWLLPGQPAGPLASQELLGLALFALLSAGMSLAIDRYRVTRQRLDALKREAALAEARTRLDAAEAGRRRSDAAARLSRAQLEAVVNAMSDGVIVVDTERRPVLVNEALARFTGLPGPEVVGATGSPPSTAGSWRPTPGPWRAPCAASRCRRSSCGRGATTPARSGSSGSPASRCATRRGGRS